MHLLNLQKTTMSSGSFFQQETTKRTLALASLSAFGFFILYLLGGFITTFLGALIFYVLFTPWMNKMTKQWKWSKSWSAIAIILLSFVIVLIPIMLLCYLLYSKVNQ